MATAVYSVQQIRDLEHAAINQGTSGDEMMLRAGQIAFHQLQQHWPEAHSIVVICGGGNNGGDGYVLARIAKEHGLNVQLRYLTHPDKLSHEAATAYQAALTAELDMQAFNLQESLSADVIVDAILGIGLKNEVRGDALAAIDFINQQNTPVLALDIPSGLDADHGTALPRAVKASVTVTFIGLKQGLLTGIACDYCGEILICDLELPQELLQQVNTDKQHVNFNDFKQYLSVRKRSSHKGDFGYVLVIGGHPGMSGAPLISALGAARVGSGLTTIATHPDHAACLNCNHPEIMCHGVESGKDLQPLFKRATVVVMGPGLGQSKWSQQLFKFTLKNFHKTIIMDAGALHLLATQPETRNNWILTPHPGEAGCLLEQTAAAINERRFQSVQQMQRQFKGVALLKGAGTLITDKNQTYICTAGNPGMSSGGMGDLLSGLIAGLIAQGLNLTDATVLAACLHATAADNCAKKYGERGIMATDLLPFIRKLLNP